MAEILRLTVLNMEIVPDILLKSDSNITRAITHVEHHRDTIIDLRTFR